MEENIKSKKKNIIIRSLPTILVLLLMAFSVAGSGYFYWQYQNLKQNPDQVSKNEVDSIVRVVSKSMMLPQDETPNLATVSDAEALKEQAFFEKAENGDKILMYTKARKAIIYRPSTKRVIQFGPIFENLEGEATQE